MQQPRRAQCVHGASEFGRASRIRHVTDVVPGLTCRGSTADTEAVDFWTLVFLIGGILLIASEFVAPSLLTVFLGASALITAGLRGVGLLESLPLSFLVWSVVSLALVIPLRPLAQRFGGKSVVKKDHTDVERDRDSMGEIVEVVDDIGDEHEGRIRFQGTTWQAKTTSGTLKKGERAQLIYRQGSLWMVEAVSEGRDLFAVDGAGDTATATAAVAVEADVEKKR